jgi:hypothetical protein
MSMSQDNSTNINDFPELKENEFNIFHIVSLNEPLKEERIIITKDSVKKYIISVYEEYLSDYPTEQEAKLYIKQIDQIKKWDGNSSTMPKPLVDPDEINKKRYKTAKYKSNSECALDQKYYYAHHYNIGNFILCDIHTTYDFAHYHQIIEMNTKDGIMIRLREH